MSEVFQDQAPSGDTLTDYDRAHMITYLRVFDAAAANADWREVVRIVFERDPDQDPATAKRLHDTHLERARWLSRTGYRQLLDPERPEFSRH